MYNKINYYSREIERLINKEDQLPITCEIDLTNNCQNDCSYCIYKDTVNKNGVEHFDYWTFQKLLGQLKSSGVKSITFTGGGEPLLHPRAYHLIGDAYRYGFELGLITNGILLNDFMSVVELFTFIRVSLNVGSANWQRQIDNLNYVLDNRKSKKTVIGVSFVISKESDIKKIHNAIKYVPVDYKQYKYDCRYASKSKTETKDNNVFVNRTKAVDRTPCAIAGLIGVVCANSKVYYCCQKRFDKDFCIGDLDKNTFSEIWLNRKNFEPDISKCVMCRYSNYAEEWKKLTDMDKLFLGHRNFL